MLSLRQSLAKIGKETPIRIPSGLSMECKSMRDMLIVWNRLPFSLLIISPLDFIESLKPIRDHKNKTGMPTILIGLEHIYQTFSGRDEAEKVKRCLYLFHHFNDMRYAMLVGDVDRFPVRFTKWYFRRDQADPKYNDDPEFHTFFVPVDLYYAALHSPDGSFSDWDGNYDGYFGVIPDDKVDVSPDISVGRIPASTVQEVKLYVSKVIRYELLAHDSDWSKEALFLTGDWLSDAPVALEDILKGYDIHRLYSQGSTFPPVPSLINWYMNTGVGFVIYIGHGNTNCWVIEDFNSNLQVIKRSGDSKNIHPWIEINAEKLGYIMGPPFGSLFLLGYWIGVAEAWGFLIDKKDNAQKDAALAKARNCITTDLMNKGYIFESCESLSIAEINRIRTNWMYLNSEDFRYSFTVGVYLGFAKVHSENNLSEAWTDVDYAKVYANLLSKTRNLINSYCDDLNGLNNSNATPLIFAMSCETGQFAGYPPLIGYDDIRGAHHSGTWNNEIFTATPPQPACIQANDRDSMAEAMTVRHDSGAVAYIGCIMNAQSLDYDLLRYFFSLISNCTTLGDAWQVALNNFYSKHQGPSSTEENAMEYFLVPWKFNLFGDPSLRVGGIKP